MKNLSLIVILVGIFQVSCRKDEIPPGDPPTYGDYIDPCEVAAYYNADVFEVWADTSMLFGDTMSISLLTNNSTSANNYCYPNIDGLVWDILCWAETGGCVNMDPAVLDTFNFDFVPEMIGLHMLNFESDSGNFVTVEIQVN